MKTLIVFYSLEGNTKLVAAKLAEKLGAELLELKPIKAYPTGKVSKYVWGGRSSMMSEAPVLEAYSVNPLGYERIILGTPIWAGLIAPPLRTFLQDNDFSHKKISAFACSGGGSANKAFIQMQELTGSSLESTMKLVDPAKGKEDLDTRISEFIQMMK